MSNFFEAKCTHFCAHQNSVSQQIIIYEIYSCFGYQYLCIWCVSSCPSACSDLYFLFTFVRIYFNTHEINERLVSVCSSLNIKTIMNTLVHKQWYSKQENFIIL